MSQGTIYIEDTKYTVIRSDFFAYTNTQMFTLKDEETGKEILLKYIGNIERVE